MTDEPTERPVEEALGDLLREAGATLATAESATGGLVSSRVVSVPGASDYFDRGYVTYAYAAKLQELGVPREDLDEHGAVSAPVARAMARGARDAAGVDWAVATTGTAGPTGGTEEKPVGTVFVGVAHAGEWGSGESSASADRYEFDGDRTAVREAAAEQALTDLLAAVSQASDE